MGLLKKIFKKKPGGTLVGNILRAGTKLAASTGLMPGAGLVSKLLPDAPPLVQELAQEAISTAVHADSAGSGTAKANAIQAKSQLLQAGATDAEASAIGAAVHTATRLSPAAAVSALDAAASSVPAANFVSKEEIKEVLNGALEGAKSGAAGAYMDKTEAGQQQVKEAVDAKGAQIMPYVLLGSLVLMFLSNRK